jgi:hypothetical protein
MYVIFTFHLRCLRIVLRKLLFCSGKLRESNLDLAYWLIRYLYVIKGSLNSIEI